MSGQRPAFLFICCLQVQVHISHQSGQQRQTETPTTLFREMHCFQYSKNKLHLRQDMHHFLNRKEHALWSSCSLHCPLIKNNWESLGYHRDWSFQLHITIQHLSERVNTWNLSTSVLVCLLLVRSSPSYLFFLVFDNRKAVGIYNLTLKF